MSQYPYCSVNGVIEFTSNASVSVLDESYLFGRGIFETLKVSNGEAIFLEEHLYRLIKSAEKLGISHPGEATLTAHLLDLVEKNNIQMGRIKIVLSKQETHFNEIILCFSLVLPTIKDYHRGVNVGLSQFKKPKWKTVDWTLKTTNYLFYQLAREEAMSNQWFECLIGDDAGWLCEGSYSNVFFMKGDTLFTPSLDYPVIPGIIRQKILQLASANGIITYVKPIAVMDCSLFDHAFLTNSIIGVVPISRYGDRRYFVHPWISELTKKF